MSKFDKAVAAQQNLAAKRTDHQTDVDVLLRSVGVADAQRAMILMSPTLVDQIVRHPELAQSYARLYPAGGALFEYPTALQQYGFSAQSSPQTGESGGADAMAANLAATEWRTSAAGKLMSPDGVLVDPATGDVVFPNDPDLAGSPLWMSQVYKWDDTKVAYWRKELAKTGYLEDAKGGITPEFIGALGQYHYNRYLFGGGQPVALESTNVKIHRRDFDGLLDPAVLQGEVKQWLTQAYGDEGTESEQKYWSDRVAQKALALARRKGYSPTSAASVAASKVQQDFLDSPSAKAALDNDFDNTTLKDELQNAAAATEFLAYGR